MLKLPHNCTHLHNCLQTPVLDTSCQTTSKMGSQTYPTSDILPKVILACRHPQTPRNVALFIRGKSLSFTHQSTGTSPPTGKTTQVPRHGSPSPLPRVCAVMGSPPWSLPSWGFPFASALGLYHRGVSLPPALVCAVGMGFERLFCFSLLWTNRLHEHHSRSTVTSPPGQTQGP